MQQKLTLDCWLHCPLLHFVNFNRLQNLSCTAFVPPCGPADVKLRLEKHLPACLLSWCENFGGFLIVETRLPFSRIAHLPACVRFAWLVWPLKCVCTCTGSDFNATDVYSGSHNLCIRK
jgi:hypothetical protein